MTCVLLLGWALMAVGQAAQQERTAVPRTGNDHEAQLELFERYARVKFGTDRPSNAQLDRLVSTFSEISRVQAFQEDAETKLIYQQFFVAAAENAMKGDVLEGMFLNFLLSITPPSIALAAIAPELGDAGKLKGILDIPGSDLRKHIELQEQTGYHDEPNFRHYAAYLRMHRDEPEPTTALVLHMYRVEPSKALYAVMADVYALPNPPPRLSNSPDVNRRIRPLLLAEHAVCNVLWRERWDFDVDQDSRAAAKRALAELAGREEWWVRLYVAAIMKQHESLRDPDALARLMMDSNDVVRRFAAVD